MYDNFSWIKASCCSGVKLAITSYAMFKLHRQMGKHEIELGKGGKTGNGHRKVGQE
jgi:hypothetical protein